MNLSRSVIEELDEKALRDDVLLPLFRAMDFHDPMLYHGGVLEQGKDIVMWKSGEIRERINYAVVVKAGKISGKAAGKSSAAEVFFQIQQCFGDGYLDKVDLVGHQIDVCWVVTSGTITKEARGSLKSALNTNHLRGVELIDGDKLWELTQRFLPATIVLDQLTSAGKTLDSLSGEYRILATTGGESVALTIEPRDAGMDGADAAEITTTFQFPDTPEGREINIALQEHFRSGSSVRIPAKFVSKVQVPTVLQWLMGSDAVSGDVTIGEASTGQHLLVDLVITDSESDSATLSHVDLKNERAGSEQAIFSNVQQDAPWLVRLSFDRASRSVGLTVTLRLADHDARTVRNACRFFALLSRGGSLEIRGSHSGIPLMTTPAKFGSVDSALTDPRWLEFLDDLVYIQERMRIALRLPEGVIGHNSVELAHWIAGVLRRGHADGGSGTVTLTFDRDGAANVSALFGENSVQQLSLSSREKHELLGVPIDLGDVWITGPMTLGDSAREELRRALEESQDDAIPVRLDVAPGAITIRYIDWEISPE